MLEATYSFPLRTETTIKGAVESFADRHLLMHTRHHQKRLVLDDNRPERLVVAFSVDQENQPGKCTSTTPSLVRHSNCSTRLGIL